MANTSFGELVLGTIGVYWSLLVASNAGLFAAQIAYQGMSELHPDEVVWGLASLFFTLPMVVTSMLDNSTGAAVLRACSAVLAAGFWWSVAYLFWTVSGINTSTAVYTGFAGWSTFLFALHGARAAMAPLLQATVEARLDARGCPLTGR